MDGQDWNPTVIRGGTRSVGKPEQQSHRDPMAGHYAKLAAADAPLKGPRRLSTQSVAALVAWRSTNSLNQKQLDQRCSFPPNTINGLEARRLAPSPGQLQTLNRLLKTGLTLE